VIWSTDVSDTSAARSVQGRLQLRFALERGRTVLACCERTAPFHLQRLLYLEAHYPALARATVLNGTAGLFAGDRLELAVEVGAGAAASLTTPTMTRVFGMREGHARVRTRLTVAAGGYLEYLPEPTLLCRAAALHQRTALDLEPGARAALGEVFAFGRRAHGERHAYRSLDQQQEIHVAGDLVLCERLHLTPDRSPDAVGMLGDYAAYGSLQLLNPGGDSERLLAATRTVLAGDPHLYAAASLLSNGQGVVVRALGEAPSAVQRVLTSLVHAFRRRTCPR